MVKHSLRRHPSYTSQRTRRSWLNPIPRGGGQDLSGTYYHVHNYVHFINIVNNALAVALSKLKRSMPQDKQGASLIDLAVAPYLDFDPTTNRVLLHAHIFSLTRWRQGYKKTIMSKFTLTRDYTTYSLDSRTNSYHLKAS